MLRSSAAVRYALAGAVLSLGAPLGWLLIRVVAGDVGLGELGGELARHPGLYAYLLMGTCTAFTLFGMVLGDYADRLTEANAQLRERAITDALTGLRNPRYFHERLREECDRADRENSPLGLVMIDLDRFKDVNDRYGHGFGDLALAHVGRILAACARTSDVACRIGGEEFALLCPGTLIEDVTAIAERVRDNLERSPLVEGQIVVRMTASFGVAVRWPGTAPEAILRAADRALYSAKEHGRNRVEVVRPLLVRGASA